MTGLYLRLLAPLYSQFKETRMWRDADLYDLDQLAMDSVVNQVPG